MRNALGISVYLNHFDQQKEWLETVLSPGQKVFTSLQIPEEQSQLKPQTVLVMLQWLKERGAYIIADISPRVLKDLAVESVQALIDTYPIDNVRLDDGFSVKEVAQFLEVIDVTVNASTQVAHLNEWANITRQAPYQLYAQFNYYPRIETGMDSYDVQVIAERFRSIGIRTMAFIAGDEDLRGPLYRGLPTIEMTRDWPPVLAYVKLMQCGIDEVFVGDVKLSQSQWNAIDGWQRQEVLELPVTFTSTYDVLYDERFNIRLDSPRKLLRISQARRYLQEALVEPGNCLQRLPGMMTLDNKYYGRYAGEIQLVGKNLPADDRVNVIGQIDDAYLTIFELDIRGLMIQFVEKVNADT
ncbi:MupG family TIM beta-alpha barrel fold protein [Tuanshanicoccus lijuaniae]|uniref:MupG family TIM beta-alpha barrel fold protein n=1 Tax=Aerococcaceae bacterium zg-1292 TaxID=2774330 RepID=UPI001BD88DD2|nr:DUF871 family protein [Aerococcaceae bacterium zg-A91]MBS4457484.1 DUF871 family protein [Aerococcaceae bacterium zg-BR33]